MGIPFGGHVRAGLEDDVYRADPTPSVTPT